MSAKNLKFDNYCGTSKEFFAVPADLKRRAPKWSGSPAIEWHSHQHLGAERIGHIRKHDRHNVSVYAHLHSSTHCHEPVFIGNFKTTPQAVSFVKRVGLKGIERFLAQHVSQLELLRAEYARAEVAA